MRLVALAALLTGISAATPALGAEVERDYFVMPVARLGLFEDRATEEPDPNLILGLAAGMRMRSTGPVGFVARPSVEYKHLFGETRHGDDVELMVPIGPRIGPFIAGSGVMLGWDRFVYDDVLYPDVGQVGLPLFIGFDLAAVYGWVGVVPQWFTVNPNDRKSVAWSTTTAGGFGDEFRYVAGVGVNVKTVRLRAQWQTQIADYGTQHEIGLGIGVGF